MLILFALFLFLGALSFCHRNPSSSPAAQVSPACFLFTELSRWTKNTCERISWGSKGRMISRIDARMRLGAPWEGNTAFYSSQKALNSSLPVNFSKYAGCLGKNFLFSSPDILPNGACRALSYDSIVPSFFWHRCGDPCSSSHVDSLKAGVSCSLFAGSRCQFTLSDLR